MPDLKWRSACTYFLGSFCSFLHLIVGYSTDWNVDVDAVRRTSNSIIASILRRIYYGIIIST